MNKGKDIKNTIQGFVKGECHSDELEEAIGLFSDPYHHLDLRPVLYGIWEEDTRDARLASLDNPSDLLNQIHHRINLRQKREENPFRKALFNGLKIAAVLVIGLLAGILVTQLQKSEPTYYTFIAPKGSISQMVLPDNTMVYLNSGSELKYSVEGKKGPREVYLKGEAWFDVTPNKNKPFWVFTPFYHVRVTGTRFNVKAYPDDEEIVTALESGSVQVTSSEKMRLLADKTLLPGQQLVYNRKDGTVALNVVRTRIYTAWKDNQLIFINMDLKKLFVLLERKYGVDFRVDDDLVLDYHYDGIIRNETILEVLELLNETLPITYKIEGQNIIIQKE